METPALRPRGPTSTTVPLPLGEVLRLAGDAESSGRFEEARRLLDYILAAEPDEPSALHLSGVVAFRLGDPEKALAQMERSLELGIDTPLYLRNICEMYRVLGRLDEALDTARQAVVLAPSDPLCLQNIAIIHFHRLEIDEAVACADAALRIDPTLPGAHFARAEALLLRGDWEQGWEEYEWRFRIQGASPLMPPTNAPQWDGKPLSSETLLLIADQGFGDVVQFCRYIPWAAERCQSIAVACSKPMSVLVRQQHPHLNIFEHWKDCPPFAAYCALSGLPRLHGTRPGNVPAPAPYLHADPKRVAQWRERLDKIAPRGYRRVGLVWAGQPKHNNDRNRSTTLSTFAPLGSLRGIALVSLQKGPATVQAGQYFGQAPLLNIGAEVADYDDTLPVCITAGSLGEGLPRRDLWISPHHAMYFDGVLIEARDLVNGVSVVQAENVEVVEYFHIELDGHDVILAEGAASETFVDDDSRGMFHNAHEYALLYPDNARRPTRYCAPRLDAGFELEAIRQCLAQHAGLAFGRTPAACDVLRGYIDIATTHAIAGWAQNIGCPDAPVCLDIYAGGRLIGQTLANLHREDLAAAGVGDGGHAFVYTPPDGTIFPSARVEVRRSLDGALLGRSNAAHRPLAAAG